MMKKQNKKRGFTIVELTIVVSVIAILSAVLIPTFAGIIKRSKISSDEQAVRNMNTVIATIVEDDIDYNDIADALDEAGYNVLNKNDAWNPLYKDFSAYWLKDKNAIVLVEDDKIVYPGYLTEVALDENAIPLKSSNYVATSNATTADAVVADIKAAINNGNSITLTETVDLSEMKSIIISEEDEITVDLGGNTLTTGDRAMGNGSTFYAFDSYGDLTIKNAKIEARGVQVQDGGTLTLENVEVTAQDKDGGSAIYVWEGGKAIINGGTYTNSQPNPSATDVTAGATTVISYGDLTINGGTFTSNAGAYAICVHGGTASINNATVTGARGGIAVEGDDTTVTITNCTVTSNWTADASCYALYVGGGNVTATNSTFTSANGNHTYGSFTTK